MLESKVCQRSLQRRSIECKKTLSKQKSTRITFFASSVLRASSLVTTCEDQPPHVQLLVEGPLLQLTFGRTTMPAAKMGRESMAVRTRVVTIFCSLVMIIAPLVVGGQDLVQNLYDFRLYRTDCLWFVSVLFALAVCSIAGARLKRVSKMALSRLKFSISRLKFYFARLKTAIFPFLKGHAPTWSRQAASQTFG